MEIGLGGDLLERPTQVRYSERHRADYRRQLVVVDKDYPARVHGPSQKVPEEAVVAVNER